MSLGDMHAHSVLPVDLSNPVNPHHPLNQGRIGWWLSLPGWDGGKTWLDLQGLYPMTLTSMTAAGTGWQPGSTQAGALGPQVAFNGTSSYATGPSLVGPSTGFTVAAWIYPTSAAATNTIVSMFLAGTGDYFNLLYTAGTTTLRVYQTSSVFVSRTTAAPPTVNAWSHLAATWNGGTTDASVAIYSNGVKIDNANGGSAAGFSAPSTAAITLLFGGINNSGIAAFYHGSLNDVGLWNRCLSANEIEMAYDLSSRGYPGALNRITAPVQQPLLLFPATGGGPFPWFINSSMSGGFWGGGY